MKYRVFVVVVGGCCDWSPLSPFGGSRQNEKCETQSGALAFAKFFVQKNVQKAKGLGYFVFGGEVWTTVPMYWQKYFKTNQQNRKCLSFFARFGHINGVFLQRKSRYIFFFNADIPFRSPTFLMGKSFLPPCKKGTIKMRRQSYHLDSSHIRLLQTAAPKRHLSRWYLPRNWKSKRPPTSFRYRITCCTTNPFPLLFSPSFFMMYFFCLVAHFRGRKEGTEKKSLAHDVSWVWGGRLCFKGRRGGGKKRKKMFIFFRKKFVFCFS